VRYHYDCLLPRLYQLIECSLHLVLAFSIQRYK
jgi:hypothetical protein